MKKNSQLSQLIGPSLVIIISLAVAIMGGNILLGKINATRTEIAKIADLKRTLESRLSTLQEYDKSLVDEYDSASVALPSTNPSVYVVAQLRKLALDNAITLNNLRLNSLAALSDVSGGVRNINISFELKGEGTAILNFVDGLSSIAPLVNIDSINMTDRSSEGLSGEIKLTSYFSPLLDKLPALDTPISKLSQADDATLQFVSTLDVPTLFSATASGDVTVRQTDNPFSTDY